MSGTNPDAQAISQHIQELEQVKEIIREEMGELRSRKAEIDVAISAIESLESGTDVYVPLGGGASIRTEVENVDEIVVDIGSNFAAERPREEAIETLKRKQARIDEQIADRQSEYSEIASESEKLTQQAQQQLSQQMQGMGGERDE